MSSGGPVLVYSQGILQILAVAQIDTTSTILAYTLTNNDWINNTINSKINDWIYFYVINNFKIKIKIYFWRRIFCLRFIKFNNNKVIIFMPLIKRTVYLIVSCSPWTPATYELTQARCWLYLRCRLWVPYTFNIWLFL